MSLFDYDERESRRIQYVLDSNYFIGSARHYYDMGIFPCFWKWTKKRFQDNSFIIIDKVYSELLEGSDELVNWVKDSLKHYIVKTDNQDITKEFVYTIDYIRGLSSSNHKRYEDNAVNDFALDADPWLIAYARINPDVCIVTDEMPETRKTKVKIPEVCREMRLQYMKTEDVLKLFHPVFDCEDFDR